MGEIAKWALLIAGLVAIVLLITQLPIIQYLEIIPDNVNNYLQSIVDTITPFIVTVMSMINLFFFPEIRFVIPFVIAWIMFRRYILWGIRLLAGVYHYIFK